jgi:hypothetical protein
MTISGFPNIRVIIREAEDENLTLDVPNIVVKVEQDTEYNVNILPAAVVPLRTGSYQRFADVALLAYTASYISGSSVTAGFATSASYAISASYAQFSATSSVSLDALSAGGLETVLYVTQEGSDANNGSTIDLAFRTIKQATLAAQQYIDSGFAAVPRRVSIRVKTGYYTEEAPITVPANTSILGDDLRTVVVKPTSASKGENLFLMNNGSYASGLRLEGCEIDNLEDPRKGFFFALAPSASIATSPYIQNCTAVNTPPHAFYAPLDPDNENPFVGNGPGGMIVDDSVLDPYSPLRSMIVDAYTQVAFNGIGICVRGRGYAQLVSFFTNFSRVGVYALEGGHASLLNSNTTFGDYGLRASGSRILVVPDTSAVTSYANTNDALLVENAENSILQDMITQLRINGNYSASYAEGLPYYFSTMRDGGLLLDAIVADLRSPSAARVSQFTQGLFKGQDITPSKIYTVSTGAIAVFPVNDGGALAEDFILSFEIMRDYIISTFTGLTANGIQKIQELFAVPIQTLTSVILNSSEEYLQVFGSLITSTSHDFSYAGSVSFWVASHASGTLFLISINLNAFSSSERESQSFHAAPAFWEGIEGPNTFSRVLRSLMFCA